MFLLPPHLRRLFERKGGRKKRAFSLDITAGQLSLHVHKPEPDKDQGREVAGTGNFDIFPQDPSIRNRWFSLSFREREVAALICMGYKNNVIAEILGIAYGTVQTHLQNIFRKLRGHSRGEVRTALKSWAAEEWWGYHHY